MPSTRSLLAKIGLPLLAMVACGWLALAAVPAYAQTVQRSFVNPSFEVPYINTGAGCYRTLPANWVPGWSSTEAGSNPAGFNSGCPTNGTWTGTFPQGSTPIYPIVAPYLTANTIQQFRQPVNGVNAVDGAQWAELNSDTPSRLYQELCLANTEVITWSLSHRARSNTVNPEVMEFNIGTNVTGLGSTLIVRGSSVTNGSQGTTTALAPARLCPTSVGGQPATCNVSVNNTTGWVTYSGSFTWNQSGLTTVGFQAIYGENGSAAGGNFLDAINLTLKPFVQLTGSTVTYTEGGAQPVVSVQIVGVVPTGGMTIPLTASGTASSGSDYTLGTFTIPAGDYGQGQVFNVPLTMVNDTVIEDNETLTLTIPTSPSSLPYVVANTTSCGGAAVGAIVVNIIDNDIDVLTTKTASVTSPVPGTPFTYTVTYTNNTNAPTVAPLTAHDITAAISDPVPAGLTFTSWTCTGSNTTNPAAPGVCPAASGSGAISGSAVLPARASITYTVTASLSAAATCNNITNTSTITPPAAPAFTEGTSVQAGFVSPAPPSPPTANNTASVIFSPCADLSITKTNTPAVSPNDQAADTVTSGTNTTYTLVVTNNGQNAANGAVVKDTATAGLTCPAAGSPNATCSSTGGSACPGATFPAANLFSASGVTLGNMPPNTSATITVTCSVN